MADTRRIVLRFTRFQHRQALHFGGISCLQCFVSLGAIMPILAHRKRALGVSCNKPEEDSAVASIKDSARKHAATLSGCTAVTTVSLVSQAVHPGINVGPEAVMYCLVGGGASESRGWRSAECDRACFVLRCIDVCLAFIQVPVSAS